MTAIAECVPARVLDPEPLVLLGDSPAVCQLHDDIAAAAGAACVLVDGEPGLDLEQVACALHRRSGRGGTCVQVIAAAGEDGEAIASALSRARGGTAVIAELPRFSAGGQRRLLQAARAAADLVPAPAVIATMSLGDEGGDRTVRRDLLRWFKATRVSVPALRSRREDIAAIARALVALACAERGEPSKVLADPALTLVSAMPWHGNLAELRQVLVSLVHSVAGPEIELGDVLTQVRFDATVPGDAARTLRVARRQFEREYIREVLRREGGRVGDAARTLGIQRTNLYRKARQLGITVTRPEHA